VIKKAVNYLLLAVASLVFLFPLAWCVISSFKPENDIVTYPPRWIPKVVTIQNYQNVFHQYPYLRWAYNSVFIAVVATLLTLVCSSLAAYAFGRFEFRFKKPLFSLIIAMLLIPIQAYVVPLFIITLKLNMLNTFASIILPSAANVTSVFILTSFFKSLPKELEEAARLDGCGEFGIFLRVMLPLAKPALSTVTILVFISNWNNFLWPMITIRDNNLKTLPVGIAQFVQSSSSGSVLNYGTALAAACLAVVPTTIVYLFFQRFFVEGIATAGIKG
jgi:multiple sugar transport system permease protein